MLALCIYITHTCMLVCTDVNILGLLIAYTCAFHITTRTHTHTCTVPHDTHANTHTHTHTHKYTQKTRTCMHVVTRNKYSTALTSLLASVFSTLCAVCRLTTRPRPPGRLSVTMPSSRAPRSPSQIYSTPRRMVQNPQNLDLHYCHQCFQEIS